MQPMYDAEPIVDETKTEDPQMGDPVAIEEIVEEPAAQREEPAAELEEPAAELEDEAASGEVVDADAVVAKPKDNRNWLVVNTYSGYENKVKANLERRIHSMGMQDKIFRVLVPMEDEVEFKDGKRKITPKKVFPGYVLVEMIMDDQSWYVVRNTQGVPGFVGSPGPGEKAVPLQEKEVKTILKQMGIETPKLKIDFAKGDRIKVTSIFGRETPVELEFYQIEKV